jgi:hypothetical protein
VKARAAFASIALSLLTAGGAAPLLAHPGVGIVMDSRGNVFYTDLARVWRIAPDGARTVAVPNVHTHELCLDAQGNLYGEHLWYEGESTNRWGHRVWRRSPDGTVTNVVPAREGFRTDYSFVRDVAGNMYSTAPAAGASGAPHATAFLRRSPDGTITSIARCSDCRNVRWMTATADGILYFIDTGDLREISPAGRIRTLARDLAAGARSVPQREDWRLVMGLWTDAARDVYVAVYGLRQVKRVSPEGRVDVVATSAFPWAPSGGLIAPNGDLWLLESTFANAVRVRHVAGFGAAVPVPPAVMSAGERAACSRSLDEATGATGRALTAFESANGGGVAAARAVLAAATADRDRLEATPVSPSCARSQAEELIYLNHRTLGFQGWIAARSRRPPGDYDLASIVRRARVHRERGRDRLRSP